MNDEDKMVNALWRAQQINEGKPDPGADWEEEGIGYFGVLLLILFFVYLIGQVTH